MTLPRPLQILLVEDDEAHAELIRRAFAPAPLEAELHHVSTLAAARAALQANPTRLVITDLQLPDGRGVNLLAGEGAEPAFPLVLMTSHGNEEVAVEAMKAGALDYVVKSEVSLSTMPRVAERAARAWLNIEARRAAQAALRRSQARLSAAQRVAQVGCFEIDPATGILWLSDEAYRILGVDPATFPATPEALFDRIIRRDREHIEAGLLACGRATPLVRTCRLLRPDGSVRVVEMTCQVEADEDAGRHVVGTLQDVTARTRLEEEFLQAQKNEAVGKLASGVAHDFNNLLMGISSAVDIALKRAGDSARLREILDEIKRAAVGGASITRQLLQFAGTRRDADEVVQVDARIGGSADLLARLLDANIALRTQLDAGPAAVVGLDPGRFHQVLMNLVVNARDAMPDGGAITVRTRCRRLPDGGVPSGLAPGDYVVLEVTDTGSGIDPEVRAHIFEPFFTTKGAERGSGLGLATIHTIVTGAGGAIEVDSVVGAGTSFRIWLPQATVAATVEAPPVRPPAFHASGRRALLVEDEPLVRAGVEAYLVGAGFRVVSAANREELEHALDRHGGELALVVTDMVLPGISGAEVVRAARDRQPEVAVLCMSAYSAEILAAEQMLPGGTPTLQKPFAEADLVARLRELLPSDPPPMPARSAAPTVLLVEDEHLARLASAELLTDEGFTVLAAASAGEALRVAAGGAVPIDAVVTDIRLPDLPGPQLVASLRAQYPGLVVIYVSGQHRQDPAVGALVAAGDADYLEKPIDIAELSRCLTERLQRTAVAHQA